MTGRYMMMVSGAVTLSPWGTYSPHETATGASQVHVWFDRPTAAAA